MASQALTVLRIISKKALEESMDAGRLVHSEALSNMGLAAALSWPTFSLQAQSTLTMPNAVEADMRGIHHTCSLPGKVPVAKGAFGQQKM